MLGEHGEIQTGCLKVQIAVSVLIDILAETESETKESKIEERYNSTWIDARMLVPSLLLCPADASSFTRGSLFFLSWKGGSPTEVLATTTSEYSVWLLESILRPRVLFSCLVCFYRKGVVFLKKEF